MLSFGPVSLQVRIRYRHLRRQARQRERRGGGAVVIAHASARRETENREPGASTRRAGDCRLRPLSGKPPFAALHRCFPQVNPLPHEPTPGRDAALPTKDPDLSATLFPPPTPIGRRSLALLITLANERVSPRRNPHPQHCVGAEPVAAEPPTEQCAAPRAAAAGFPRRHPVFPVLSPRLSRALLIRATRELVERTWAPSRPRVARCRATSPFVLLRRPPFPRRRFEDARHV